MSNNKSSKTSPISKPIMAQDGLSIPLKQLLAANNKTTSQNKQTQNQTKVINKPKNKS